MGSAEAGVTSDEAHDVTSLSAVGEEQFSEANMKLASARLAALAEQSRSVLDAENYGESGSLLCGSLGMHALRYKTAVTLFSARLSHMRQRLAAEARSVKRLGEAFSTRADAAIDLVTNQFRPFELKLNELEDKVEDLLAQGQGRVSLLLSAYRSELKQAAATELESIEAEIEGLVRQFKASNEQLDELLQLSEDAKLLTEKDIQRLQERMSNTLQLFDILTRQELLHLAQRQQQCALREIEEFTEKLSAMHLMEHVLETLVDKFAKDLEDYQERRRLSRALTFLDLSTSFAGPRPQSVCSVLVHLVRQKERAKDVGIVFVYGVAPPQSSGTPLSTLFVPPPSALRAAVSCWKKRTDIYGHKATSYAVIRVEGSLLEVFSVPFLEPERFIFETTEELRVALPSEFPERLAGAVNEANMAGGLDVPHSLVVYLGQVQDDQTRPPPTRILSHNRITLARHMLNHVEPPTKELTAVWERLQQQLNFVDAAAAAVMDGVAAGEAVQLALRRLDVEILCFTSALPVPPCRRDPHLREAFHYMQIQLTRTSSGFVLPADSVVVSALTSLVRIVHSGGPSCPVVISTSMQKKKHFWGSNTYTAVAEMITTDVTRASRGSLSRGKENEAWRGHRFACQNSRGCRSPLGTVDQGIYALRARMR
ncbi:uncharacterized protein LOC34621087 [Cyclospora cayetanensis]|uniref:Uncharacterized protein LOC34621087 n=1 Tax=Cyclospora cayetanensis TaxID=88456 RepID=A0A6P6S0N2_9EIME|nr:uncharacterized protein LOC34621087 [Cyclospora cayetanensis]